MKENLDMTSASAETSSIYIQEGDSFFVGVTGTWTGKVKIMFASEAHETATEILEIEENGGSVSKLSPTAGTVYAAVDTVGTGTAVVELSA